jgi:glycosyltransferase involved in cell wall biosynthesis
MKKINFLLKYPNLHLLPIIEKFTEYSYEHSVFYINDIKEERKGYDWVIPSRVKTIKIKWFRDFISIFNSDIIISWGIWMDWKFYLLILFATYFKKNILILSESENLYNLKRSHIFLKYITSFFLRKKRIYFLSMGGFKHVLKDYSKYGFKKNNFLPYGFCGAVSSDECSSKKNIETNLDNRLKFLYVGQLIHRKGLDILFNALSVLEKNKYVLQIAGEGKAREILLNLAKELQIENNIKFLGHQTSNQLEHLYRNSDILLLPSRFDGWGAVLNEAASYSLPLIASNMVRGAEELIKTYENGFVFNDVQELKRILIFISNNRNILKNFSEASFLISKSYSPISLAQRLDLYIKKILKDNETNHTRP